MQYVVVLYDSTYDVYNIIHLHFQKYSWNTLSRNHMYSVMWNTSQTLGLFRNRSRNNNGFFKKKNNAGFTQYVRFSIQLQTWCLTRYENLANHSLVHFPVLPVNVVTEQRMKKKIENKEETSRKRISRVCNLVNAFGLIVFYRNVKNTRLRLKIMYVRPPPPRREIAWCGKIRTL